jgi:fibronectin-binding autotransporter adhesin
MQTLNICSQLVGSLGSSRIARKISVGAACLMVFVGNSTASAQTNNTWASATTGGGWTTPANWSVNTEYPGQNTGDTATLGNVTGTGTTRIVTLGSNVTIAGLTFTQTTAGNVNELDLQSGSSSATTTLTVNSTLALTAAAGTALLYVDNTGTYTGNAIYAGNVTVGGNGVIEMGTAANPASATKDTPTITGNVTLNTGGLMNIDLANSFDNATVNGNLSVSGGTLVIGKPTNPAGTTLTGSVRFQQTGGAFLASSGVINSPGGASASAPYIFSVGGTSAEFDSGVTGTFFGSTGTTELNVDPSATTFTLSSDIALPALALAPVGATSSTVNITLKTVTAGGTLSLPAGLTLTAGPNSAGTAKSGSLEVTAGSNINLGTANLVFTSTSGTAASYIVNTNGFKIQTGHALNMPSSATNVTIEGGGTLTSPNFVLTANTGSGGTSVVGATTLQATGAATAVANNLGNAAGSIDPTSTFLYTGTATGANINTLTSNRAIGRLAIGNGTAASILNLATATLAVSADVTVNALSTLDLNGQNLTEGFVTGAANGGLNGSGTVQNSSGTATLTLDTTGGNGSYSGVLQNSGSGTLALAKVGSGTQTLSGTSSYTGGTTVSGGTLKIGSTVSSTSSAIGNTSGSLTVNNAIFDLAGFAQTVGALSLGSGTIADSGTAKALTTSGVTVTGTGNTINSGVTVTGAVGMTGASLADNGALTGNVTVGTGTLTGTGSVGGTTSVTGGTINGSGLTLGGLVSFNSGGGTSTLGGSETATGGISVGSGAVLAQTGTLTGSVANAGSSTFGGTIVGSSSSFSNSAGVSVLSSANTYGGGTTITGGKVYVKGGVSTVSSGTGSGAVGVSNSGSTLAGNGTISGAVTLAAGTTLYSGGVASGTPSTGPGSGMTLNSTLAVNSANLTFALNTGNVPGATVSNPNTSTTYLTTTSTISFTGSGNSVTLVDLTTGGLTLRMNQPYLLVSASSDSMFHGLVVQMANGQLALSDTGAQGIVLGVSDGMSDPLGYSTIAINEFGADGVSALANTTTADPGYYQPYLYLAGGDLEVVPEPETWALMLGGFGLLVLWQRRRSQAGPGRR